MQGAGIGSSYGLAALAQNINTQESAQQELATLSVLSENIKRDQRDNLMFQEMEAQQYEEIRAKASTLLERDRERINQKALQLQSKVREQIKQYGSRKAFNQNGGLATLRKYKTDLLYSDEFMGYQDNKVNMERILTLQAAGKGHLLSEKDMMNLQLYQSGQADKITYSGLMNEIDYPAEFYEFGSKIPDINVLNYKDNFTRIFGNYIIENGEHSLDGMSQQQMTQTLLAFMKKKGYTGIGKDEFNREEEARVRAEQRQYKRQSAVKSGTEEEPKMSWTSMVNNLMNDAIYGQGVKADQLLDENFLTREENEGVKNLIGDRSAAWNMSFKPTATKSQSLLNGISNIMPGKYFKPASAMAVNIGDKKKLAELTDFGVNEDGTVNYKLDTTLYNANGQKFTADDVDDYIFSAGGADIEGKAKVVGSFLGFRTADGKILMNVTDKKGNVLEKDDKENRKAYKNKDGEEVAVKHSMFIALQSEDDNQVFYKEVDINSVPGQTRVSNMIGPVDDVNNTLKTRKNAYAYSQQAEQVINKNKKDVQDNFKRASTDNGAFGGEVFVSEAQAFQSPNTGANRTNLIKAYYMALDSFSNDLHPFDAERAKSTTIANQNLFTRSLSPTGYGNELQTAALDFNIGDTQFIKTFTDFYNNDPDLTPEHLDKNNAFAKLWHEYYKTIVKK